MRALRHIRSAVKDAYEGIRRLRQQLRDAEDTIRRQAREIDMLTTSLRRLQQGREPVSESESESDSETEDDLETEDEEMWGFSSPHRPGTPEFIDNFNSDTTGYYSQSNDEEPEGSH
ncbi:hypothetical protein PF005_g15255 [Phytophthora fragariae]|uniref:Uncharacterized protein n=1 Tax=Phytophthora fragariae TaxID=53985 RepID=A0A6A3XK24_9STRA|nr:hypothetical protein PF003_g37222 [Phytophthora fragariae]KAE8945849.1 hypothetical protein PF009_g4520 [Phytophthora fragariae]KAE9097910.1 hypothetical protein PF010_g15772 [Phytophthora fragariae]KAE9098089.1 hypothetical protein PF007_g16391 [Phytophthora fragariae]KAE9133825.1 hypothetical protein PF006_g14953 [Phytophthora fragariae]